MTYTYYPAVRINRSRFKPQIMAGFTLLELLVVLTILGVVTLISVPMFSPPSEKQKILKETKQLAQLIRLASDDANLNSNHIGVQVKRQSYTFLIKVGEQWKPIRDKIFRKRKLDRDFELEFINKPRFAQNIDEDTGGDFQLSDDNESYTPNIIITRSGEISPFSLRIIGKEKIGFYELIGQFSGHLRIKKITEE